MFALLTRSGVVLNERVATTLEIESGVNDPMAVSYTHLRAHETVLDLVCRLLLEKKKKHTGGYLITIVTHDITTNIESLSTVNDL